MHPKNDSEYKYTSDERDLLHALIVYWDLGLTAWNTKPCADINQGGWPIKLSSGGDTHDYSKAINYLDTFIKNNPKGGFRFERVVRNVENKTSVNGVFINTNNIAKMISEEPKVFSPYCGNETDSSKNVDTVLERFMKGYENL